MEEDSIRLPAHLRECLRARRGRDRGPQGQGAQGQNDGLRGAAGQGVQLERGEL